MIQEMIFDFLNMTLPYHWHIHTKNEHILGEYVTVYSIRYFDRSKGGYYRKECGVPNELLDRAHNDPELARKLCLMVYNELKGGVNNAN